MRLMQGLFERHLRGLYEWGKVDIHIPEEVEKLPGQRRNAFGKFKEVVSIRLGIFDLTLESPNEAPPLGRITLDGPEGSIVEQSLDEIALDRIGAAIKTQHERMISYAD